MADAAVEAPVPLDWMITTDDQGMTHALGDVSLAVAKGGRAFKRNGIKWPGGRAVRWLVGELNGVRVYFNGDSLVLTTEDLYP